MEKALMEIYLNTALLQTTGMIVGALFFVAVGLRELRSQRLEGLLFISIAGFFFMMHLYFLWGLPHDVHLLPDIAGTTFWIWLVSILGPALIMLFVGFGLFYFVTAKLRDGLVRTFFGLTLFCYLFMVGTGWPVDVRGIVTIVYSFVWLEIEVHAGS